MTLEEKYEILLKFVRHISIFIDSQNPHLIIKEAENLLKEIGELNDA